MADKITIELSDKYKEHLELLKQIIPSSTGEAITGDSEMVEALIDSFMSFVQQQAGEHEHSHSEGGGCCGGDSKGKKEGGGCCGGH